MRQSRRPNVRAMHEALKATLHDAHVELYRSPAVKWHLKQKLRSQTHENRRAKRQEHREMISDQYVRRNLCQSGLHKAHVPQTLIEVIREHLRLTRYLRELKEGTHEKRD